MSISRAIWRSPSPSSERKAITDVVVEKAAFRGRFGHLRSQIFRHIEIAVTLSADELDVQPVFGRVIVKFANGCGWHGLCNDRWPKMFHVRAVAWFRSRAAVLSPLSQRQAGIS